jgi:hypothetical protein
MKKPLFAIALATAAALVLSGCNLLEGLHQFNPEYRNPVPFSTPWFDRIKEKRAQNKRAKEQRRAAP